MVNIRRKGGTTFVGGKPQQTYLGPPPPERRGPIRRNITDVVEEPEPVEQEETIDAPDQFIDTEAVNYIPIQSANGAIRAVLF
jgi:hypothetical protein